MAFAPAFRAPFQPAFSKPAGLTRYTLTLQPAAAAGVDTFVRLSQPDTNNGTAVYMGIRAPAVDYQIPLIKFDLTSIPAGASLVSATLSLYAFQADVGAQLCAVYRILDANSTWTESGAKWNYKTGTDRWAGDTGSDGGADAGCSVIGTDYSNTLSGTFQHGDADPAGTEYSIILSTTEFALMLESNNGFCIRAQPGTGTTVNICSSDHPTAAYRPKLVVVYDV